MPHAVFSATQSWKDSIPTTRLSFSSRSKSFIGQDENARIEPLAGQKETNAPVDRRHSEVSPPKSAKNLWKRSISVVQSANRSTDPTMTNSQRRASRFWEEILATTQSVGMESKTGPETGDIDKRALYLNNLKQRMSRLEQEEKKVVQSMLSTQPVCYLKQDAGSLLLYNPCPQFLLNG
jgi:hypothetical protein